eukprot:2063461-Rhodomonas_salina.2
MMLFVELGCFGRVAEILSPSWSAKRHTQPWSWGKKSGRRGQTNERSEQLFSICLLIHKQRVRQELNTKMESLPFEKHVSIKDSARPEGKQRARRSERHRATIKSAAKINFLHKHLTNAVLDYHLEESSSSDEDVSEEQKNNFLLFCPALKAWIRSTQGLSAADVFSAWSRWTKTLGSQEQTVGGTEEPKLGMYVLPSRTAPESVQKDAGVLAGKLTKIEQSGDGKLKLTVRWAESGMESFYEIPNRWEMMMAANAGREPPNFVLTPAAQEDIEMAIQHEEERAFYDSMTDEHLQIFKTQFMRKFDLLSPSRKKELYERTGHGPPQPGFSSPKAFGGRRNSSVSPRPRSASPRPRYASPYTSPRRSSSPRRPNSPGRDGRRTSFRVRPSSPSNKPSSPMGSPGIRPLLSPTRFASIESKKGVKLRSDFYDNVGFVRADISDSGSTVHKNNYYSGRPTYNEPHERLTSAMTSGTSEGAYTHRSGYADSQLTSEDGTHSPSVHSHKSGQSMAPPVPSVWQEGLKKWKALRKSPRQEKEEKRLPIAGDSASQSSPSHSPSHSSFGEDMTTFTGFYGEEWGNLNLDRDLRDEMLDTFFRDCCMPRKERVYYKEMLPRQRPKSAQVVRPSS